jgi:hypothetical protein
MLVKEDTEKELRSLVESIRPAFGTNAKKNHDNCSTT